jgi:hypothetical protein
MANSSLATYTNISPNHSTRTHAIDTVTIHCTAGSKNNTAKEIVDGSRFVTYDAKNGASCNYAVGGDGSIAVGVNEADKSWCTSNKPNDHRAVTIEVASNTAGTEVTDKAYNALIDLLTDICKRNGIKKLVWSTSKNDRVNHLNGCNMTAHRDYAAKACPGEYLYNREGAIAETVNKRLAGTTTTVTTVTKEEEEEVDIKKLLSEMTDEQAYTLYTKAMNHAKTLPEPDYSKGEGYWAKAKEQGIVDGTNPRVPMERVQVVTVLGRKGLI